MSRSNSRALTRAAHHEAGHVAGCLALGGTFNRVVIHHTPTPEGYAAAVYGLVLPSVWAHCVTLLCGSLAEGLRTRSRWTVDGGAFDLGEVERLLPYLVDDRTPVQILSQLLDEAATIVTGARLEIAMLATALRRRRALDYRDVQQQLAPGLAA